MTKHHLLKEEHQKDNCIYCNHEMKGEKWKSAFESLHHYKVVECKKCSKENRVKVDFHGSGHDGWDGTHAWKKEFNGKKKDGKIHLLEDKIKVCERVDTFGK